MLQAVPHRHTHRGAFEPGPLPGGLLAWLQDDATAEGAMLAVIGATGSPQMLLELGVARTSRPTARRAAGELATDRSP